MGEVHHFTYGWITPTFAFAMSFLGSLLGLVSTARARATTDRRRRGWLLVLAAWAIGGTGIWVMHFMGMIGFTVPDSSLHYDVLTTVASFLVAVLMVGAGLFIVGYGQPSVPKILLGGPITGISVAFMHYTGMAAMRLNGEISYDRPLMLASYGIAIVAATVALWFTVVVRAMSATLLAAGIMGLAVSGMHYTGMAAIRVDLREQANAGSGVDVNLFLAPIVMFVIIVVIALASTVMALPSLREQDEENAAARSLADGPIVAPPPPGVAPTNPGGTWAGAAPRRPGAGSGFTPVVPRPRDGSAEKISREVRNPHPSGALNAINWRGENRR